MAVCVLSLHRTPQHLAACGFQAHACKIVHLQVCRHSGCVHHVPVPFLYKGRASLHFEGEGHKKSWARPTMPTLKGDGWRRQEDVALNVHKSKHEWMVGVLEHGPDFHSI